MCRCSVQNDQNTLLLIMHLQVENVYDDVPMMMMIEGLSNETNIQYQIEGEQKVLSNVYNNLKCIESDVLHSC